MLLEHIPYPCESSKGEASTPVTIPVQGWPDRKCIDLCLYRPKLVLLLVEGLPERLDFGLKIGQIRHLSLTHPQSAKHPGPSGLAWSLPAKARLPHSPLHFYSPFMFVKLSRPVRRRVCGSALVVAVRGLRRARRPDGAALASLLAQGGSRAYADGPKNHKEGCCAANSSCLASPRASHVFHTGERRPDPTRRCVLAAPAHQRSHALVAGKSYQSLENVLKAFACLRGQGIRHLPPSRTSLHLRLARKCPARGGRASLTGQGIRRGCGDASRQAVPAI